jgi:hypothetical protein
MLVKRVRYIDSYTRLGQKVDPPKLATLLQLKIYFPGMSLHDLSGEDVIEYSVMRRKTIKASTLLKTAALSKGCDQGARYQNRNKRGRRRTQIVSQKKDGRREHK